MYELSGTIKGMTIDIKTGKPQLLLEINEKQSAMNMFDELHEAEKLSIKIAKFREKRSLDANAYCWVLIDKLAKSLNMTKTEIYREAIKEIGGVSDIVCVKNDAVEKLCDGWERNGIGWQTDIMPSKLKGCTNVILYYGSSTYDTAQMSRLISNIVQDCESVGIDTRTPEEIENLLSLWAQEEQKNGF